MASEANKFRVGLFVTVGFLVAVGTVIFLGAARLFEETVNVMVYFDESVQGLEAGSPMKYRGVKTGRVTSIDIIPNSDWVAIEVEVDPTLLSCKGGEALDLRKRPQVVRTLKALVDKGMRVRLVWAGITGQKYLELDFFDPQKYPVREPDFSPTRLWLPTCTSVAYNLEADLTTTLDRLSQVDFPQLGQNANALLKTLDQFAKEDVKQTSAALRKTLEIVNGLLDSPGTKQIVDDLAKAVSDIQKLAGSLSETLGKEELTTFVDGLSELLGSIKKLSESTQELVNNLDESVDKADVPGTVASFREATGALTKAAGSIALSRAEVERALEELRVTLRSIRRLVDYLERDPAALLHGKRERPRPR